MIEIVPATREHALELAPRLRARDLAEIAALTGQAPAEAMQESLDRALHASTALLGGRPIAIWGLGTLSMMFGPGVPWMLGSDELAIVKRAFLRESRRQLRGMLQVYSMLANHVDARNAPAIRYLRWLGFSLEEAAPWGHAGLPFHRFTMARPKEHDDVH